jgi:hypothetical protein
MHNAATRRTSRKRRASATTRRGSNISMLGKTIISSASSSPSPSPSPTSSSPTSSSSPSSLSLMKKKKKKKKKQKQKQDIQDQRGSVISTVTFAIDGEEEDDEEEEEVMTLTDGGNNKNEIGAEPLLDSFDSYIVVSVLTATASFAALFEANSEQQDNTNNNNNNNNNNNTYYMSLLHNISVLTCTICSLSGIYATVVFSFSSIYGRTAVGTGRIDIYEEFLKSTGSIRYKAFLMYLLSLILFIVLLVITATEKIDKEYRLYFLVYHYFYLY